MLNRTTAPGRILRCAVNVSCKQPRTFETILFAGQGGPRRSIELPVARDREAGHTHHGDLTTCAPVTAVQRRLPSSGRQPPVTGGAETSSNSLTSQTLAWQPFGAPGET